MKDKAYRRRSIWIATVVLLIAIPSTAAQAQQWQTNGNNIYYNSGTVGIGTNDPAANLHVESSASTTFRIVSTGDNVAYKRVKGSTGDWYAGLFGTADYSIGDVTNSNATYLTVKRTSGNVGIGTASPAAKLDVAGITQTQTLSLNSGAYSGSLSWGNNSYASWYMTGSAGTSSVRFKTWDGSSYSDKVTFENGGNVGIGTASPGTKLDVAGITQTQSLFLNSGAYSGSMSWGNNGYANWYMTGSGASSSIRFKTWDGSGYSDKVTFENGGNVGIGTPSPGAKLDVNGSIYTNGQLRSNGLSLLVWGAPVGGPNRVLTAGAGAPNIESQHSNGLELGTAGATPLVLYTNTSERLRIDSSGTTTISGNLNVTGNINAKYQDVAEWVPSSEKLTAGTVVVLDSSKSNQVIASTSSYDTRVAGVISAQPGITLGEKGEGKVLVATTGRIKIKVDASKSRIRIGDLLVTSDVPGVAMKSEPLEIGGRKMHMPGTLIGKALEPLAKGKGEILVLLSLQ